MTGFILNMTVSAIRRVAKDIIMLQTNALRINVYVVTETLKLAIVVTPTVTRIVVNDVKMVLDWIKGKDRVMFA